MTKSMDIFSSPGQFRHQLKTVMTETAKHGVGASEKTDFFTDLSAAATRLYVVFLRAILVSVPALSRLIFSRCLM